MDDADCGSTDKDVFIVLVFLLKLVVKHDTVGCFGAVNVDIDDVGFVTDGVAVVVVAIVGGDIVFVGINVGLTIMELLLDVGSTVTVEITVSVTGGTGIGTVITFGISLSVLVGPPSTCTTE